MNSILKKIALIVSVIILSFGFSHPSRADSPTDQLQGTVNEALEVLKDPELKAEEMKAERREKLRNILFPRFDFPEMARRSLGFHWRKLSPQEREEFVELFTDLLEQSYVDRIESYSDEKFVYLKEVIDQNYAQVQSRILTPKGEEFSVNYNLHSRNGNWKVYDIVVENISMVNNYRSQFNRVISNSSYQELVDRLKIKQAKLVDAKKR